MEKLSDLMRRIRATMEVAGIETAALDTRLLVRQGGKFSDMDLITLDQTPLSAEVIDNIGKLVERRVAGEPVSRILGEREFWGLRFQISPDTLDPRADTETLVAAALKWARSDVMKARHPQGRDLTILDLGTGSGCILIALLSELPLAGGVGIDLNPGAVTIAKENATALGVADRVEFRQASWFEGVRKGESFDLIVSNPPYIPESDIESLAVEVKNHDPILALVGGDDGLVAYKKILTEIKGHLKFAGRILFEIGFGQEKDLIRLVEDSNMRVCDSHYDLGGILRVVEISNGEN